MNYNRNFNIKCIIYWGYFRFVFNLALFEWIPYHDTIFAQKTKTILSNFGYKTDITLFSYIICEIY